MFDHVVDSGRSVERSLVGMGPGLALLDAQLASDPDAAPRRTKKALRYAEHGYRLRPGQRRRVVRWTARAHRAWDRYEGILLQRGVLHAHRDDPRASGHRRVAQS
jgi:hypothetical protein